jgi:hypothetical protein
MDECESLLILHEPANKKGKPVGLPFSIKPRKGGSGQAY